MNMDCIAEKYQYIIPYEVVGKANLPPRDLLYIPSESATKGVRMNPNDLSTVTISVSSLHSRLPLDVVVEEISVQQCLDDPADINNPMMPVVLLRIGTINPIQNVERTVGTHEENIIASQVFNFSVTLQDDQLRKNSNCLQVNRKCPEELNHSEL